MAKRKKRAPIRLGDPSPFKAKVSPNLEQLSALRKRHPDTPTGQMKTLQQGLLGFGGVYALLPALEEDLVPLVKRGQLWPGTAELKKGRPGECHFNVANLWDLNHEEMPWLKIATGYVLSRDGLWRQHSWLVLEMPDRDVLIETTQKRLLYFGYLLNEKESYQWLEDNLI